MFFNRISNIYIQLNTKVGLFSVRHPDNFYNAIVTIGITAVNHIEKICLLNVRLIL
jgi:hypothetical protein